MRHLSVSSRCCICTHCWTFTRCCLLHVDGGTEGSVVFTMWRQCAHPTNSTNTLFLHSASVSPLNVVSIGSAVFALLTHWFRPPTGRAGFRGRTDPSPRARIARSCICKTVKAWENPSHYIIYSISRILHYNGSICSRPQKIAVVSCKRL